MMNGFCEICECAITGLPSNAAMLCNTCWRNMKAQPDTLSPYRFVLREGSETAGVGVVFPDYRVAVWFWSGESRDYGKASGQLLMFSSFRFVDMERYELEMVDGWPPFTRIHKDGSRCLDPVCGRAHALNPVVYRKTESEERQALGEHLAKNAVNALARTLDQILTTNPHDMKVLRAALSEMTSGTDAE